MASIRKSYVNHQNTSLQIGAREGVLSLVVNSLRNRKYSKKELNMALRWSVRKGHTEIIHYLLKNGSDVTLRTLDWALRTENWEMIELLLESFKGKRSLLFAAKYYIREGKAKIVKTIIQKLNNHLSYMEILLIESICKNHLELTTFLLDAGVSVHFHNDEPIKLAVRRNCIDIVKLLVSRGADIRVENDILQRIADTNKFTEISNLFIKQKSSISHILC
jgi:ankyrin repeat protein